MNKILLTIIFFLATFQLVSAQVDHLTNEKEKTRIRIVCGEKISSSPPLYVLQYKQQEHIIDTADLKTLNRADIKRIIPLKDVADLERYGDKGKNGVILITLRKAAMESFLRKEELD